MSMTRMVVVAVAVTAAAVIGGFILFAELWHWIGLGGAIAVLVAVLLYIGWRKDKKDREAREELEGI